MSTSGSPFILTLSVLFLLDNAAGVRAIQQDDFVDGERIPYSAYISRVFNFANFANLESFAKFIQRNFEPLHCNTHGQHEFAKFIQRIPSKQPFAKF